MKKIELKLLLFKACLELMNEDGILENAELSDWFQEHLADEKILRQLNDKILDKLR